MQNSGWNVFYNTADGKQTARTGYNGMFVAAALVGTTASLLSDYSKDCRDNIDNHGNTETERITLTEARWSSKYDNRW